MNIIISNYSKNSLALIQWANENRLKNVTVCYIDTGWSAKGWLEFVAVAEWFSTSKGFSIKRLKSRVTFQDLMDIKRGFPSQQHQWCSLHLKGITLLQWLDKTDPECNATILMAKRNNKNIFEKKTTEFIEDSEYHGERRIWHPLFNFNDIQINQLSSRTGITPPIDSCTECSPCINSNAAELSRLSETNILKTEDLEEELGMPMFSFPDGKNIGGIRAIVQQAKEKPHDEKRPFKYGCSSEFGCGS